MKEEKFKVIQFIHEFIIRVDKEMDNFPKKYIEIKTILKEALTDKINDREVYMKGVDASYFYEGYNLYKTQELL